MSTFPDVKKKLGFGCMRLPMDGEKVDYAEFTKMVDEFMAQGFNYFDTARVYIGGQGETAIRDCVVKRYPRDSFILTDKLSDSLFNSEDEIRPLFEKQLESCGVDYFDFYLLHSQTKSIFEKYKKMHAYEHAFEDWEAADWLDRQLMRYETYGFGLWAVVLKETGEVIGQCGLTMQEVGDSEVLEVGYLFRMEFWHHGYALEAAAACRDYAFEKLGAEAVYSIIRENNGPSRAVAERNGMTVCGST